MRIIICSNLYPPHFIGGAELIAHYHAKILKGLGHRVIIFTGDEHCDTERHSLQKDTYDGLTVYRVSLIQKDYSNEHINFSHRQIEHHFDALIEYFSPDVIHFHNMIGLSVGLIHTAKRRMIKTVLTVHDHWGFCYKNTIIKRGNEICHDFNRCEECMLFIHDDDGKNVPIRMRKDFFAMQLREVDVFISPSQYLAETYILAGLPKDKFKVIWNGIDMQRFTEVSKTRRNGIVRFTFIGHLGMHKGVHILLDALPLLSEKGRFKVNIVGDGELMTSLKQQVKSSGLNNAVKFWGKIDNNRVEEVYRETDVLILPSVWPENQPVTITEAMASRTPVIASSLGGIPELVENGVTGYLFQAGDARELAKKMLEFILNHERLKLFGENAYEKIVNNTFENQVNKILKVYYEELESYVTQQDEIIIACVGQHINIECVQAMDSFLKENTHHRYRFVMSDWIQDDQLFQAKLLWVVDNKVSPEEVIIGLRNKMPLLVPEDNAELKELCISANCGLYYRDAIGAMVCLEYFMENKSIGRAIGRNGYEFFSTKLSRRLNFVIK